MRKLLLSTVLFVSGVSLFCQTTASPELGDISGMYTFVHEGEFVQITVDSASKEPKDVTGFVSRLGEDAADQDQVLEHFFSGGKIKADSISFKTKKIHDVWFEFTGTVSIDQSKKPGEEGRVVIKGTLKRYRGQGKNSSAEERELTMRSFPNLEQP